MNLVSYIVDAPVSYYFVLFCTNEVLKTGNSSFTSLFLVYPGSVLCSD